MLRKFWIAFNALWIGIFCICLIAGYVVYTDILDWAESVKAWAPDPVCNNPNMKKAKKYHGVLVTEYREDLREWGFYRDNQWCSLYRSIPAGVAL